MGACPGLQIYTPLLPDLQRAVPLVGMSGSDSASLDNMLELLLAGGMDLFRAMRLLIPPAGRGMRRCQMRCGHSMSLTHGIWSPGMALRGSIEQRSACCLQSRQKWLTPSALRAH